MDDNNIKMEKCANCPVNCGTCIAQKSGHKKFCDKVDPNKKDYNPKYKEMVEHLSCGTIYNKHVAAKVEIVPNEENKTEEKKDYPSLLQQGKNFLSSAGKFISGGMKIVDDEEFERRRSICDKCPLFDKDQGRCRECGCFIKTKAKMQTEKCPKDYWDDESKFIYEVTGKEDLYNQFVFSSIVHPCSECGK